MARPSELTDEVTSAICRLVARGRPLSLAAPLAGYTVRSAMLWQARGKADLAAGNADTAHARFFHALTRARGEMAGPLIDAALDGATSGTDVRGALSTLKALLPAHFGDRALEVQAALEDASESAPSEGPGDGQVRVELVRCPSCGDDQLPGKAWCGDCRSPMGGAT